MTETLEIVQDFAQYIKEQPNVYMGFELNNEDLSDMMGEAITLAQKNVPGLSITSV